MMATDTDTLVEQIAAAIQGKTMSKGDACRHARAVLSALQARGYMVVKTNELAALKRKLLDALDDLGG